MEKKSYIVGFVKYGFYLAQGYLEKMRLGDDYLGLTYSTEVIYYGAPNCWELEDLNPKALEVYLNVEVRDLPNPTGPWSLYILELKSPVPLGPTAPSAPEAIDVLADTDFEALDFIEETPTSLPYSRFSRAQC